VRVQLIRDIITTRKTVPQSMLTNQLTEVATNVFATVTQTKTKIHKF